MNPNVVPTISGIDLYHGDIVNDWHKVAGAGVGFVFLKASEGVAYVDRAFREFRLNARQVGIPCGAYHFFHGDLDGKLQANNFLNQIKNADLELPAVLDWEPLAGVHVNTNEAMTNAVSFLQAVKSETGVTPMIYGDPSFLSSFKLPIYFSNYPLWIAEYGVQKPKVPAPWTKWTFWQNSESGRVNGIPGTVDTNLFIGVKADLLALKKA